MTEGKEPRRKIPWLAIVIVLFILCCSFFLIFLSRMFVSVGVGHAVLLVDPIAQTVSDPILGPSYLVKAPWVGAVDIYYATDTFEDVIPCFSSDQLEIQIQVLVRWSLDRDKIKDLYQEYPNLNYKEKAIESIMEETIRLVTKNFTTLQTIEYRDVVVYSIEQAVFEEIREETSLRSALTHLEMDIKDIKYPAKYTSAIEDKLVAEQQKIQADFERQRILILANATAQQRIIEAYGASEAKIIEANGTKEAINLILNVNPNVEPDSLAKLYIWLEAMKELDVPVILMGLGEDGVPIIIQVPTT